MVYKRFTLESVGKGAPFVVGNPPEWVWDEDLKNWIPW